MNFRKSLTWRMAKLLVKHARDVLPSERQNWAQAMSNEIDHLPNSKSALRWAMGCVFTSYIERVSYMETGNLRISRAVLTVEMLLCFGLLSMRVFSMLFWLGNSIPLNPRFIPLLGFSSSLIGPIGLIFAFRLIALNRTRLTKTMLAVLIIPAAWTFIVYGVNGNLGPEMPWAWDHALMLAVLPVLGVAHLIYLSRPNSEMKIVA